MIPDRILADRGERFEIHGAVFQPDKIGFHLQRTSPYRPDWKAVVERHFKTMNIALMGDKSNVITSFTDNQVAEEATSGNLASPDGRKTNG